MPYSDDIVGIYKIVNKLSGKAYVGQSVNIKKRVAEHFRLLDLRKHPNQHLQRSYDKNGRDHFEWSVEVRCEDVSDLDLIENAFLSGEAYFNEELAYNIATCAKIPMRGKFHTEKTKKQISKSKLGKNDHVTEEYREKLRRAQLLRFGSDPEFVEKVRYIVHNPDMSYAERGRVLGIDTSNVRKLALRYTPMRETLPWLKLSSPDQCSPKTGLK